MGSSLANQLVDYYRLQGIHPEDFTCRHASFCRQFAHQARMTETKMSLVGSRYGEKYPRIAVLSLDPPLGEGGKFSEPFQRTTAYVTAATEAEDYTRNRPNPHWAMTQIIVRDILCLFGYCGQDGAAVVLESYSNRPIENVTPYFAHVNAAKCSMNDPAKGQANPAVHRICSQAYLLQELIILQPDILVSQGKSANLIAGGLLGVNGFKHSLPQAHKVQLGPTPALWLPMDHPARSTGKIRQRWPFYLQAIQKWIEAQGVVPAEAQGVSPTALPDDSAATEQHPSIDYGLYKCSACGRLVLGFDQAAHSQEVHAKELHEYKAVQ